MLHPKPQKEKTIGSTLEELDQPTWTKLEEMVYELVTTNDFQQRYDALVEKHVELLKQFDFEQLL